MKKIVYLIFCFTFGIEGGSLGENVPPGTNRKNLRNSIILFFSPISCFTNAQTDLEEQLTRCLEYRTAIKKGKASELMKFVYQDGVNVTNKDLRRAIRAQQENSLQFLLNVDSRYSKVDLSRPNRGQTSYEYATVRGWTAGAKLFPESGGEGQHLLVKEEE